MGSRCFQWLIVGDEQMLPILAQMCVPDWLLGPDHNHSHMTSPDHHWKLFKGKFSSSSFSLPSLESLTVENSSDNENVIFPGPQSHHRISLSPDDGGLVH
jgi:hypothetical protein